MAVTVRVRWNGCDDDPETIIHHGHSFVRGQWVSISSDISTVNKLKANSWFDVEDECAPVDRRTYRSKQKNGRRYN